MYNFQYLNKKLLLFFNRAATQHKETVNIVLGALSISLLCATKYISWHSLLINKI